jgi:hypothetical protein
VEKSTPDLTPQLLTFAPASHLSLTLPYSWEGKGKTFLAGRGRIQSLSRAAERFGERFSRSREK